MGFLGFSFMLKCSWKFSTASIQILTRAKCKPFLNLLLVVSRYTRWPWAIDTENIVRASFSLLISPTWRNLTIAKLLTLWHCDKTKNSENNYFFSVRTCCISQIQKQIQKLRMYFLFIQLVSEMRILTNLRNKLYRRNNLTDSSSITFLTK